MHIRTNRYLCFIGATFFLFTSAAACSSSDDDDGGNGTAGNAGEDASGGSGGTNAGTNAGTSAGTSAGTNAGANAGASAGTTAGTSAGSAGSSDDAGPLDGGEPVDLGTAGDFVILAKTGISTVPISAITGDIGVSPAAASYITGFSLSADSTNVFSTAPQVVGRVYAANYEPPTPSNMTTAVSDMERAFTDAAGRAPDVTELGAGDIGGMTLEPGVYAWGTGLLIPTDVTLNGDETAVWIFQIAGDLTLSNDKDVALEGGALAKNIFWQVSGQVTLGTTAHLEGIVLSQTAITLGTGASVNGRLLAQTAVDIDSSTVVEPSD